jgi:type III pantothenate kinase
LNTNLVIDCGNTRIKYGVFTDNQLIENGLINDSINTILERHPSILKAIIASVTQEHLVILPKLQHLKQSHLFTNTLNLPIENLYETTQTLGSDRLAASIGAFTLHPNSNVLTIDAGTCIKYNFVNEQNQFIGGAISPGLSMRLKALHQFTNALPLIDFDENYENLTGKNTKDSILSGALIGAVCEVESMIQQYQNAYSILKIVFTGGNANYLCKQLKNRFFADEHLILKGLNAVLNFQ